MSMSDESYLCNILPNLQNCAFFQKALWFDKVNYVDSSFQRYSTFSAQNYF